MKYNTSLGEGIDGALAELDELLSSGTLELLTELWDTERGGFYRSAEERDRRGALPDIDSTAQVINLLSSGAIKGTKGKLSELLPSEIKEKILKFTKECNTADAAKCKVVREKLEGESEKAASEKAGKPDRAEYLGGKDAFISYLDTLDGVSLSKVKDKLLDIRAAGLSDVLFDYLDGKLKSEYGYGELTELARVAAIYNEDSRPIKNARKTVESLINLALSDREPINIASLYGFFSALYALIKNIVDESERCGDGEKKRALYSEMRARAPEIIGATVKHLSRFKTLDGGFSYYFAATRATFGSLSGDVNSTVTAVHGVRGNIFACLGLTTPPLYEESALDAFCESLISAKKVKKKILFFKI